MGLRRWLVPSLAILSLVWCLVVGFGLWHTPVEYAGESAYVDSRGVVREEAIQGQQSFSDWSPLGAIPLIIPAAIAALAVLASWLRWTAVLAAAWMLLSGYSFVTGFSIGVAYLPAVGILLLATVLAIVFRLSAPDQRIERARGMREHARSG